jgi:hypothetical protein
MPATTGVSPELAEGTPTPGACSTIGPAELNLRRSEGVSARPLRAGVFCRNPERFSRRISAVKSLSKEHLMAWTGVCEHCMEKFGIEIFHNGFGDSSYAYCDSCGKTAILSGWSKEWPKGVKCTQAEIAPEMEPHLKPCQCGGTFTKGSYPRCPKKLEHIPQNRSVRLSYSNPERSGLHTARSAPDKR